MRVLTDLFDNSGHTKTLLVLLPPAEARIEDFYTQGFIDAIRCRRIKVDVMLAEITYEHVMNKTVVSALFEQVVQPAQNKGYKKIWLAGISLGALNAMYYASEHAAHLAGIHLISPYPGTGDILNEIIEAGGPVVWAKATSVDQKDERAWWYWLCREAVAGHWDTPVYLSTGSKDRFLCGQRMLADLLPKENVSILHGSHSWTTWQTLWHDWLDRGHLVC